MSSESFGTTSLSDLGSSGYYLSASGWSVQLTYGGTAVVAGQFGAWQPWSAEKRTTYAEVVWKNTTTNQYMVWTVDNNGAWVSQTSPMSATSYALESIESSFSHNLNGDGLTGYSTTTIESTSPTKLEQWADQYFLVPVGQSTGPSLKYAGAAVTAGQFAGWTPVSAAFTSDYSGGSAYEVIWKNAATDKYQVWLTDGNGHFLWNVGDAMSGSSTALQSKEASVFVDLNGDGTIGLKSTTVESSGSTALVKVADAYFLNPTGGGTGPQIKYGGAPVAMGQFGAWTPIGAEQTSSGGYKVVWQFGSADQYVVWNLDASGNWQSQTSGTGSQMAALEPFFNQDLNGTGGISASSTIEASGATSLVQAGNTYFLNTSGGAIGPQLAFGGSAVIVGQFGTWNPIGAEKMSDGGYKVVWQSGSADQYVVWNTDANGNWLSQTSGTGSQVAGLEAWFNQNLNGTGGITASNALESSGSTSLVQVADAYFLNPTGGGTGPQIKYGGAPVAMGQFGAWTPIGAEQTSSGGYKVVWQFGSADQYVVWNLDASGNWQSQTSGTGSQMAALEPFFNQDLNGVGGIATPSTIESNGTASLVQSANSYFLNSSGGGLGPQLSYGGAPVTVGQFGSWTPLGAEKMADGTYQVIWQLGATNQYAVWTTDAGGNWVSQVGAVSGPGGQVAALETAFGQDLDHDGVTNSGLALESSGNADLQMSVGTYFVQADGAASPVKLTYGGSDATSFLFNNWGAIGAEQTAAGFDVVWKYSPVGGSNQIVVWHTDSSGHWQSQTAMSTSGYDSQLLALETRFDQDFNGDGAKGNLVTPIETVGLTRLYTVNNQYAVSPDGDSYGPYISLNGAHVTVGQFGLSWNPLAVERTDSGYDVIWKNSGTGQLTVWSTDSAGNFLSQTTAIDISSTALKVYEREFFQDFNGDHIVASPVVVEAAGVVTVAKVGGGYVLYSTGGSLNSVTEGAPGIVLKYGGAPTMDGQFGAWTAIGAEKTATGYNVAWKLGAADQYTVWATDDHGNFLGNAATSFGSSSAIEQYENAFNQDLNGDGILGVPSSGFNITIDYGDNSALPYKSYFDAAIARWQQVIVGDLPDVNHFQYGAIDDILIKVTLAAIDGSGGTLASGGPDLVRSSSTNIPYHGNITVDSFDVDRIAGDGRLTEALEHEIGHALGFNTQVWSLMHLTDGNGNFTGAHAVYAYQLLSGNSSATYVPMSGGHFPESFGNELMTPTMLSAGNPLSILTVAVLQDMGYRVNYSAANSYSLPSGAVAALQDGLGSGSAVQDGHAEVPDLHMASAETDWLVR